MTISRHDAIRVAAGAIVDPRTVIRVYAGFSVASTSHERVRQEAARLGLPPPPPPKVRGAADLTKDA